MNIKDFSISELGPAMPIKKLSKLDEVKPIKLGHKVYIVGSYLDTQFCTSQNLLNYI